MNGFSPPETELLGLHGFLLWRNQKGVGRIGDVDEESTSSGSMSIENIFEKNGHKKKFRQQNPRQYFWGPPSKGESS